MALVSARADECLCLEAAYTWAWSDCTAGDCACGCPDQPPVDETRDSSDPAVVCSAPSGEPPTAGARCELVDATCVESDCVDEASRGCGCDGGAGATPLGVALVALLPLARRRGRPPLDGGSGPAT